MSEEKNHKSGIYQIRNLINGKKYIGQTVDLTKRKNEHFYSLDRGYHRNSHFQRAYNKYGKNVFKFKVLLYCEPFELTKYEQFFVDKEKRDDLYNICLECVDSSLGTTRSEETKKKISKNRRGKCVGKDNPMYNVHRYGKDNPMYNVHRYGKDNPMYNVHRYGKDNPMYGKHHSEEARKKMSKNHANFSGENQPMYGKHHSEETRKKMSKNHANFSGKNNPRSRLTEKQIFEILDLRYNNNSMLKNIAKKYNIAISNISGICRGKTWKRCYEEFMKK